MGLLWAHGDVLVAAQVETRRSPHRFRAGDVVLHRPSRERWLVAWANETEVMPCGWPESRAAASDCELIKACSDDAYRTLLEEVAASSNGASVRAARAFHELELIKTRECSAIMHL